MNDSASEASDDDSYSVAQFQRTINPAFRSSSPQPSTYESHHDPQSDLALRLGKQESHTPPSRETTMTPQKAMQGPPPTIDYRRQAQTQAQYQHNQKEELPTVPHNEYPTDGMTMFCRTAPPSERSSATSPMRPSSRDSQSEYSNPTSLSSQDPASGKQSPIKQNTGPAVPTISPDKQVQKKRSGFFSNSPFRRKSKQEKDGRDHTQPPILAPPTSRSTWGPSSGHNSNATPTREYGQGYQSRRLQDRNHSGSPEPVDPRASFQLNIGPNVFDVASPDAHKNKPLPHGMGSPGKELDPIAQALAELQGVTKEPFARVTADRYHGVATPAPNVDLNTPPISPQRTAVSAAQRGTPPPSYNDQPVKRLDLPQPAFTSAQMQQTTRKYVGQTQNMYGANSGTSSRPGTRGSANDIPRSTSPLPMRSVSPKPGYSAAQPMRSVSPRPGYNNAQQGQGQANYTRSASPNPYGGGAQPRQPQNPSPTKQGYSNSSANGNYSHHTSPNDVRRAASPQPQFARQERPSSSGGMALQLAGEQQQGGAYGGSQGRRGTAGAARPMSYYAGPGPGMDGGRVAISEVPARVRSKSVVDARQYTKDGRPILQFGEFLNAFIFLFSHLDFGSFTRGILC